METSQEVIRGSGARKLRQTLPQAGRWGGRGGAAVGAGRRWGQDTWLNFKVLVWMLHLATVEGWKSGEITWAYSTPGISLRAC